ncbi:MAG: M20/M25/M40 family metallo-hydrolase [Nanoarchaeota archaeon]
MKEEIFEFLKELISFKTTADNKEELKKCANFIKEKAEKLGLEVEIYEGEVPNLIIKRKNGKGKKVAFVTHFDVVPAGENWKYNPFKAYETEDKIYGRGATDDKGHLAAALFALAHAKELKINPILAIAGGEETQRSVDFFKKVAKEVDLAIVNDTGPLEEIHIGSSGFAGFIIKIYGKQGHSAYENTFDNPILKLDKVIQKIKELREYAKKNFVSKYSGKDYDKLYVRVVPTIIKSNPQVINIVPEYVELTINIRTIPEYNTEFIKRWFKEKMTEFFEKENIKYSLEYFNIEMDAWISDNEYVDNFIKIVEETINIKPKKGIMPGGSDGLHFYKEGTPVIEYGFSREENNIHSSNEFAYKEDIIKLYKVLKAVMEKGI